MVKAMSVTFPKSYLAPGMTFTTRGGNNGELRGVHANPHKGQVMTQGARLTRDRAVYSDTVPSWPRGTATLPGPCSQAGGVHSRGNGLRSVVATRTSCSSKGRRPHVQEWEYKAKKSKIYSSTCEDVARRRRVEAIGKSSALSSAVPAPAGLLSYDGDHPRPGGGGWNTVSQALKRVRGVGYAAPPKKGALANPFRSGGGCC